MDRNYYYRILGVRSDATPAQIKAAYDTRIARLSSADYADEPEYAKRKKEQATNAYRVLVGAAPVSTQEQKRNRFEKLNLGKKATRTVADKAKFTVVGTAITILIAVISLFSAIGDLVADDQYSEYLYLGEIQDAEMYSLDFEYYDELDTSTLGHNADQIVWDEGVGQYVSDSDEYSLLRTKIWDVLYSYDIYDAQEFFSYVTGDTYYYDNYDDYDCAIALINWIYAPSFEDVAGATSLYSGKQILTLSDYMEFLEDYCYEHY